MHKKKHKSPRSTRLRVGRNGLMYLMITALIAGMAGYSGSNLLYAGLGLTVGGLVVSLLLSLVSLRNVRIERIVPDHGVVDEPLVLRYHLHNDGLLPVFGLVLHETWGKGGRGWRKVGPIAEDPPRLTGRPFGWVMHLGPRQTLQAEAICWPRRRGRLAFETISLATAFPFGIVQKEQRRPRANELLVYPPLYRINRRLLHELSMMDPAGNRQIERSGGSEEFFGLREYRAGESLRYIDWKHSARKGMLIAREMTQPTPPRMMVLLTLEGVEDALAADAAGTARAEPQTNGRFRRRRGRRMAPPADTPDAQQLKERAISLTASLVCDAYQQGYQIGLAVQGPACPVFNPRHSRPHRARLLAALARLNVEQTGEQPAGLTSEPSVVICAHTGAVPRARHSFTLLDAGQMDRYVTPAEGHRLLQQRDRDTARRARPATLKTATGQ